MFLTDIVNKEIFSGKTSKGVCRGVGVSLKTHAVKYLFCSGVAQANQHADFCISITAVESVNGCVQLSKLRPLRPQRCARIFIGCPVYSFEGHYLGNVADLEIRDFVATYLFTDQGERYPINGVCACQDALILKKEQPYPLGQRIPTPLLPLVTEKKDSVVTKSILRQAIKKGKLIELTLSLPPFHISG